MKTARIEWRRTYELLYDEVHQDYQCTCCGTWLQDDSVVVMDVNDVPWVQDISYCPICGAEFTKRKGCARQR